MPYNAEEIRYATITIALNLKNVEQLKVLLKQTPLETKATRKPDLVDALSNYLKGAGLRAVWEKLDATQQAAIAEAVHHTDGKHLSAKFRAKYGKDPDVGERSSWGEIKGTTGLSLLLHNGILPDDLRERLKEFVPLPASVTLKTWEGLPDVQIRQWQKFNYGARKSETITEEVPLTQQLTETAAVQELPAVLRLVQAGKLSVSDKTFQPSAVTVKAVGEILHNGDFYDALNNDPDVDAEEKIAPIRAWAWPMLLQGGKVAALAGKKLALTPAGQKALNAPPHETLRSIWRSWLKTTVLDEFRRITAIKGQTSSGVGKFSALSNRRKAIAGALSDCPTGRWVGIDDFFRYMQVGEYDFTLTRDAWALYIEDSNYGSLGGDSGGNEWLILQGRYVLCVLFEYAATLGLIDLAITSPTNARRDYKGRWGADYTSYLSRYDGLTHFRVNALGAYCLERTDTYMPVKIEAEKFLRVLPNMDIVATETNVPRGDALFLDLYTTRVSERVWKIEAAKLLAVMEEGRSIAELQGFLTSRSAANLPGTVMQMLADYRARSERLRERGTATLVECTDPRLLELILHDPRTKKVCFPAGESHFVIQPGSDAAFRKALKQLGYVIPRSSGVF